MDTAGGHRLIPVNQAAHCADPRAGRVVSREAGAPRACLWLSLSPPSPFIIGPPVNTPGSRGGHRRGGRRMEGRGLAGEQLQCHFLYKWSRSAEGRQGWTKRREGEEKTKTTTTGLREGEGGGAQSNRLIKRGYFVRPGRCSGGIWSLVFICGAVLHW